MAQCVIVAAGGCGPYICTWLSLTSDEVLKSSIGQWERGSGHARSRTSSNRHVDGACKRNHIQALATCEAGSDWESCNLPCTLVGARHDDCQVACDVGTRSQGVRQKRATSNGLVGIILASQIPCCRAGGQREVGGGREVLCAIHDHKGIHHCGTKPWQEVLCCRSRHCSTTVQDGQFSAHTCVSVYVCKKLNIFHVLGGLPCHMPWRATLLQPRVHLI